jgi:hypothetical protein
MRLSSIGAADAADAVSAAGLPPGPIAPVGGGGRVGAVGIQSFDCRGWCAIRYSSVRRIHRVLVTPYLGRRREKKARRRIASVQRTAGIPRTSHIGALLRRITRSMCRSANLVTHA